MANTIQIIFVKKNDLGYLIEGEELKKYNILHSQAIKSYKKAKGMIEKIKGSRITCQILAFENTKINPLDYKVPTNRIIMIKDDGTALLLQGLSFDNYQEYHFEGLSLLKQEQKIKGRIVKVEIN